MKTRKERIIDRLTDGIDLLIDFATLGEYGLEPVAASTGGCEGRGASADWEALTPARRGRCAGRPSSMATATSRR